jgi:hypothetical protein
MTITFRLGEERKNNTQLAFAAGIERLQRSISDFFAFGRMVPSVLKNHNLKFANSQRGAMLELSAKRIIPAKVRVDASRHRLAVFCR